MPEMPNSLCELCYHLKKYALYSLNERNELLIIELNEDFKNGNISTYILDRKSENFSSNLIR